MAVTVIDNRTVLNDADTLTNWNAGVSITTDYAEATGCIAEAYNIATGTLHYSPAAPINFSTAGSECIYIWSSNTALQNSWQDGINSSHAIWLSDGTNELVIMNAGNDREVFKHASEQVQYQCFLIDVDYLSTKNLNGEIYVNSGTFASFNTASITQIGAYYVTLSKALGGGYNVFADIIRYGTEGLSVVGGTTVDRGNFYEIVLEDRSRLDGKAHGIIREYTAGAYGCQGTLKFGSAASTGSDIWFEDQNISVTFEDRDINDDKFKFMVIGNTTDSVNFILSNSSISSARPGVTVDMSSNNINTLLLDGINFSSLKNPVSFPTDNNTGHTVESCSFNRCGQIDPGTVYFRGNTISNYSGSTAAVLLDADGTSKWSDLTFNSIGTGHAIEITSSGTYNFDNFDFIDYGLSDTTDAAIYNNSGGSVTINVLGGTTPTARNSIGSTTTIVSSISININVQDSEQNPISGAYLYITDGITQVENTITDSNGDVVSSYSGSQTSGTIRIRKYGYEAYNSTLNLNTNITSTITLVTDPVQVGTPNDYSSFWSIDYTGKTITNLDSGIGNKLPINSGTTTYVDYIVEWFKWIANDASSGDTIQYEYPINSITPTQYELINGWNFGDNDNDNKYLYGGSIETSGGTKLWSNLYSIGSQEIGSMIYIIQNDLELDPWWITGNIDLLIKVKDNNTFIQSIDNNNDSINGGLWTYTREFGNLYDHNFIDLSNAGRNPVSINNSVDNNNTSGEIYLSVVDSTGFSVNNFVKGITSGTIGKIEKINSNNIYLNSVRDGVFIVSETITEYSDRETLNPTGQSTTNDNTTPFFSVMSNFNNISITFGSVTKDLNNGAGLKPYDVVIDCSGETLANVYEYLKYVTRYGSSGSTYTINGDAGQEYRNASGSTWTDVKVAPFGTFAGGNFFGARGIFVENMDGNDIQNYQLIDSNGDTQRPPEQYSLKLTNLVPNSEIRIFTGSTSEIAGVENSTDTFTYNYTYTGDMDVDIVVHALGYTYIRIDGFTLSNQNSSLPIQQQVDRWYNNP